MRSTRNTKRLEQAACKAFIDLAGKVRLEPSPELHPQARKVSDYVYHIPNGGIRSPIEAAIMNGMGAKAGVADYHLPLARHGYIGLWLEAKKPLGAFKTLQEARDSVSEDQRTWLDMMGWAGHATAVCYGWLELYVATWFYLGLPMQEELIREAHETRDRMGMTPLFVPAKDGGVAFMTWTAPRYKIEPLPMLGHGG